MSQLKVVLVGDIVRSCGSAGYESVFDHDNPDEGEVAALAEWFGEAGHAVATYASVRAFVDSPPHPDGSTIVFPLWRGGASRNRTAIVPALCEALHLPYVGGDPFVQSVCQHKSLSKLWARCAGFSVPREYVFYHPDDAGRCCPVSQLGSAVVVKPLSSACSIGVTDRSLCHTDDAVVTHNTALFEQGLGPVLCEEFVPGSEASLCIVEEHGRIVHRSVVGYRDAEGVCPFWDRLFTFDGKIDQKPPWHLTLETEPVDDATWRSVAIMIQWLGKVDCLRIDGRLNNGRFVLVELTPDIHLAMSSSFLGGFSAQGITPPALLDQLVGASMRNQAVGRRSMMPPRLGS